jgi:hypothetical protein
LGFGLWDLASADVIGPHHSASSGSHQDDLYLPIFMQNGTVKTTVEIPDPLFRQAKAAAAQKGIPLKQLFTEALREQLRRHTPGQAQDKPWMQAFGGLRQLHKENKRVERIIATEFESIDEEERYSRASAAIMPKGR